jgi:putative sterol carrier protein
MGTLHQVQVRSGVSQAEQIFFVVPSRVTGTVGPPHFPQVIAALFAQQEEGCQMDPKTVREFFETLPSRFNADAAEGVAAVYQFDLSGEHGGRYQLHIADRSCRVTPGGHPSPDVTLAMAGEDCLAILEGRLNGVSAYLSGRLRVDGDLGLAMRLASLFPGLRPH